MKRYALVLVPNLFVLVPLFWEVGLTCEFLFAYLIYPVLSGIGLIIVLIGIIFGISRRRSGLPLIGLCIAIVGAYLFMPIFWNWRHSLEFVVRRSGYMEVVAQIQQGPRLPGERMLTVDGRHQYLMVCTNRVGVDESDKGLFVLFFTSRAMFNEFSGYMYSSSGQAPSIQQFRGYRRLSPDQWGEIEQVDGNWFYVIWNR